MDDEDKSVVLLNLLHGRLGIERVYDDLVLVQPRRMGDALAGVFGSPGEPKGLGPVKVGGVSDLGFLMAVGLGRDAKEENVSNGSTHGRPALDPQQRK